MFNNLFIEYEKIQSEYTQSMFSFAGHKNFDGKRQAAYVNGVVVGKVREDDIETLAAIKTDISDEELSRVILSSLLSEINAICKITNPDLIQEGKLCSSKQQAKQLQLISCDEWIEKYSQSWVSMVLPLLPKSDYRGFIYLYYAYEEYRCKRNDVFNSEQKDVEMLYDGYFNKPSQFEKYGLVPIKNGIELMCLNPPRIFDCKKDKTLFIKNMPLYLCDKVQQLIENGCITDIAVRVKNNCIYDGKVSHEIILEEIERGKLFSLSDLGTLQTTKLYSKNYEDSLWIVVESKDITFEELCQDFIVSGNEIITQVVHLQYEKSEKGVFITHLDHEYIFYTVDEFEERGKNPNQKGSAKTRMKSFKIDNSHIPFDLKYEVVWKDTEGNEVSPVLVPFICFVLDTYFQHKDLLLEYFQSLI